MPIFKLTTILCGPFHFKLVNTLELASHSLKSQKVMTAAKQPSTNVSVLQPKKGQGLIGFLWASLDCELTLPTRCHSFHKQKSSQNEHFSFQIRHVEYLYFLHTWNWPFWYRLFWILDISICILQNWYLPNYRTETETSVVY